MKDCDLTYYHHLTNRYLNGEISKEEEQALFLFTRSSAENEEQFRQWEKEWTPSPKNAAETDKEWKHLQQRLAFRKSLSPARHRLWDSRWMRAAVITGLIFLGGGGLYTLQHTTPPARENLFVLKTGRSEKACLTLADGTTVHLNAASSLQYGTDFRHDREVVLSGEAYFEVTRQPDGIPFTVKTALYDVVVKGTKFNVSAYPDELQVSTTLIEGKVEVVYKDKHINISSGEQLNLNVHSQQISVDKVEAEQYKAWMEGRIEYDKISLQELADRLSRKYDVDIHIQKDIDKNEAFHISLRNEETIDDILKALTKTLPVRYEKKGQTIYLLKEE